MKNTNGKQQKARPSSHVTVSTATEWTDQSGILELFGLRRPTLYHLCKTEPQLRGATISLKSKSELRGKRLFHVGKFRAFLKSKQVAQS